MRVTAARWVLIGILLSGGLIWLDHFLLDGLYGFVSGLILGEDTYYSQGYSATAFRKLNLGMTEEQVYSLLGEPLEKYSIPKDSRTGWLYSWRRTDTSYRERVVIFKDGKVVKIIAEFYVD